MSESTNTAMAVQVEQYLRDIGKIGFNGDGRGWTRLAFTDEEDAVHRYAARIFGDAGWQIWTDDFGNLFCLAQEGDYGRVLLGTHLDTVTEGGNFDGVVGFIVAVESAKSAIRNGAKCGIDIVIFRAEESTCFKRACLGSSAAFGFLSARDLDDLSFRQRNGDRINLRKVLEKCGADPRHIGGCLCDPETYCAYFETHIEQARVLEDTESLGIVTSIRGPERCECCVRGERAVNRRINAGVHSGVQRNAWKRSCAESKSQQRCQI